jgi:dihydrofolate synthase/folylpolyglutamate synthase
VTFDESLAWLYSTQQFGIKLGLDNIRRLLRTLGDPQEKLTFLHVAGTNGKGSVCAMLDAILRASGRRTGLYTSPHLVSFRERIRVNGEKIPPQSVADGLKAIRDLAAGWDHSPTFFEIATALALRHFAHESCEIVVLETGMGGRLDATNIVFPQTSVITPVALDHTQWLGNTVEEVAAEKAGIIKPGVPVVSARQEPLVESVLIHHAEEAGAPVRFVESPLERATIALRGTHQRHNAALAVAALEAAGLSVGENAIARGLADVSWPGRFQIFQDRFVLDGSHNPHAARQLVKTWREVFGDDKIAVIFGALADKDYRGILDALEPIVREFLFVPVHSQRSASPADIAAHCGVPHRQFDSVKSALEASGGRTLVTGSLFLVGEAMAVLKVEI